MVYIYTTPQQKIVQSSGHQPSNSRHSMPTQQSKEKLFKDIYNREEKKEYLVKKKKGKERSLEKRESARVIWNIK